MIYRFAGCELDDERRELCREGSPVETQPLVFDLLLYLARHRDRVVTKDELIREVWGGVAVAESALTRAISFVRSAVGDSAGTTPLIRTFRGVGYRFVAETTEVCEPTPRATAQSFVGREALLASLEEAWEHACSGSGGCTLLAGEPGIGKTRTAEELASRIRRRGGCVLFAQGYETMASPPYWMWVQLLRAFAREAGEDALRAHVGHDAAILAPLVPGLIEASAGSAPAAPERTDGTTRFRLFDALSDFLVSVASDRPVLAIVDDLHWVDRSSLRALTLAARALATSRVLVLGSYRDESVESDHPLLELLAVTARQPGDRHLRIHGLDAGEIERYTELALGHRPSPALLEELIDRTAGNPLFLKQLVQHLSERIERGETERIELSGSPLPPELRAVIFGRLAHLAPACRDLLTSAAVTGQEFDVAVLADAVGLDPAAAAGVLDEAVSRGLLQETRAGHYRFAHQLIQEALRIELPRESRARLHRSLADVLERLSPDTDAVAAELAHHHYEVARAGGDARSALRWARRAGEIAARQLAHEEAADHYARALEALALERSGIDIEECELLLARGDALNCSGDLAQARALFVRAAERARACGDAARFARAALGVGQPLPFETGVHDAEGIGLFEEALERLGQTDPETRADLLGRLSLALYWAGDPVRCREAAREAVRLAQSAGDPRTLTQGLMAEYLACDCPDNLDDRRPLADQIMSTAEKANDVRLLSLAFNCRAQARLRHGDAVGGRADVRGEHELGERARQAMLRSHAATMRGMFELFDGHAGEAERLALEALALGERYDATNVRQAFGGLMFAIRLEQGRGEELEPVLRSLLEQWPKMATWHLTLGWLLASSGQREEAHHYLREVAGDGFALLGEDPLWPVNISTAALICGAVDDAEIAADLYQRMASHAGLVVTGPLGAHGPFDWYLGRVARVERRFDVAAKHLEAAIKTAGTMGTPLYGGWARCELARLLLVTGNRKTTREARALVSETLATLESCDLPALQAEARDLQQAIG